MQFPTGRTVVQEPSVTINQLCADPVLTQRVSTEIDQLGLSSSDLEDKGVASNNKKHAWGKKLWSGKTAKLTSWVIVLQLWPHSYLSLAYVSEDCNYDELTLAEFAAGYASILQIKTLPPDKRTGRLDHFVVLMYLLTQFTCCCFVWNRVWSCSLGRLVCSLGISTPACYGKTCQQFKPSSSAQCRVILPWFSNQ